MSKRTMIVNQLGQAPVLMSLTDAYQQAPWIHGSLIEDNGYVWSAYTSRNGQQAFKRVTDRNGKLLRHAPSGLREKVQSAE